jgi:pimeloyl-ACP methyl ester carboxylesterase
MVQRLQDAGFHVWVVDYRNSNGRSDRGKDSRFEFNKMVVWNKGGERSRDKKVDGGHEFGDVHCEPGGIETAIEDFRKRDIAATQADVVGHSMGGVLARVYASNAYNPNYERPENFSQGDIHRLITISSTHFGSDIPRILMHYDEFEVDYLLNRVPKGAGESDWIANIGLLYVSNKMAGSYTGAFTDQKPESDALKKIGPTHIPSHAIACLAESGDFAGILSDKGRDRLGGVAAKNMLSAEKGYRLRLLLMLYLSTDTSLKFVFDKEGQGHEIDRVIAWKHDVENLNGAFLGKKQFGDFLGACLAPITSVSAAYQQEHVLTQLFRALVFGNCRNDCVVREESSYGGLPEPFVTPIDHVLHGFAPCYPQVQDRVVELLKGGMENFDPRGFPEAGAKVDDRPARTFDLVECPNFVGMTIPAARQLASLNHLSLIPDPERPDPAQENVIEDQDPLPGTKLASFDPPAVVKVHYKSAGPLQYKIVAKLEPTPFPLELKIQIQEKTPQGFENLLDKRPVPLLLVFSRPPGEVPGEGFIDCLTPDGKPPLDRRGNPLKDACLVFDGNPRTPSTSLHSTHGLDASGWSQDPREQHDLAKESPQEASASAPSWRRGGATSVLKCPLPTPASTPLKTARATRRPAQQHAARPPHEPPPRLCFPSAGRSWTHSRRIETVPWPNGLAAIQRSATNVIRCRTCRFIALVGD